MVWEHKLTGMSDLHKYSVVEAKSAHVISIVGPHGFVSDPFSLVDRCSWSFGAVYAENEITRFMYLWVVLLQLR